MSYTIPVSTGRQIRYGRKASLFEAPTLRVYSFTCTEQSTAPTPEGFLQFLLEFATVAGANPTTQQIADWQDTQPGLQNVDWALETMSAITLLPEETVIDDFAGALNPNWVLVHDVPEIAQLNTGGTFQLLASGTYGDTELWRRADRAYTGAVRLRVDALTVAGFSSPDQNGDLYLTTSTGGKFFGVFRRTISGVQKWQAASWDGATFTVLANVDGAADQGDVWLEVNADRTACKAQYDEGGGIQTLGTFNLSAILGGQTLYPGLVMSGGVAGNKVNFGSLVQESA